MLIQYLVADIVCALVDSPEQVIVTVEEPLGQTTLRVQVAPQDVGKVIGQKGRTATALRTLLGGISQKQGQRYSLNIVKPPEPDGLEICQ